MQNVNNLFNSFENYYSTVFKNSGSLNNAFPDINSLFNSFNPFSHKKTLPTNTTSGSDVTLGQGLTYTVKTNGLSIHGNQGVESVTISPNVYNITIDSAVESVTLKNISYDPALVTSSQGLLTVNSSNGSSVAVLSIAGNHNESLSFTNASGLLSLDNTGKGIFTLSEIQLDKNQSYIANVNNLQVYGNTGTEKITIGDGVTGVQVANSIETVTLNGKSSDYNYDVVGNNVVLTNKSTGSEIAHISVNTASTGTQIQFSDKTLTAVWNDNVSWNKGWTLHNWNVTINDPSAPVPSNVITGGTNLKYSVDFSHANLGGNLASVEADVKTALDNLGKAISSKVTFNLDVLTENTSPKTLAETTATMVNTTGANGATQTTKFLADSASGTESNSSTADATLYINLADLNQMSFSNTPVANKYDLTSVLTHEILHGMAFSGNLDLGSNAAKTPFDALVTMQNGSPFFTGTHAETANGNAPIPLDSISAGPGSAYYHVGIVNDLMNDALGKGEVRTISPIDLAMLQDMGVTLVGIAPV